jgi:hypothetical protein
MPVTLIKTCGTSEHREEIQGSATGTSKDDALKNLEDAIKAAFKTAYNFDCSTLKGCQPKINCEGNVYYFIRVGNVDIFQQGGKWIEPKFGGDGAKWTATWNGMVAVRCWCGKKPATPPQPPKEGGAAVPPKKEDAPKESVPPPEKK